MFISKNIYNLEDRKEGGKWVATFAVGDVYYHTRSSLLWQNILARCKDTERSTNLFKDYQTFTDWCQGQYGYMQKEDNGSFWPLDKDIINPGNKVYSETTCCFIPSKLNTILGVGGHKTKESPLPLGVTYDKERHCFRCTIRVDGKGKFLGRFITPDTAHRMWQKTKLEVLQDALVKFNYLPNNVLGGIEKQIEMLEFDLENFKETIRN